MEFSEHGGMFTGTIDQVLNHCANLNVDELDKQCERQSTIEYIMKETGCDEAEANEIYEEASLMEVKETVDDLVKQGLVQIVGYDKDGEPLFGLTELGKSVQDELKKDKQ